MHSGYTHSSTDYYYGSITEISVPSNIIFTGPSRYSMISIDKGL